MELGGLFGFGLGDQLLGFGRHGFGILSGEEISIESILDGCILIGSICIKYLGLENYSLAFG